VRFLADESCDFAVVTALRTNSGAQDQVVLALARSEARVLLTEDKDFGLLAYAGGHETFGVVLIRFPARVRSAVGQAVVDVVNELDNRLIGAFVVVEPGRARVSRPPRVT
jgi:predicted nuclease of predicted toxin-antitoxin system